MLGQPVTSDTCSPVRTLHVLTRCLPLRVPEGHLLADEPSICVLSGQSGNQEGNYNHCYWVLSISRWRSSRSSFTAMLITDCGEAGDISLKNGKSEI
jgi:hypothetical protein